MARSSTRPPSVSSRQVHVVEGGACACQRAMLLRCAACAQTSRPTASATVTAVAQSAHFLPVRPSFHSVCRNALFDARPVVVRCSGSALRVQSAAGVRVEASLAASDGRRSRSAAPPILPAQPVRAQRRAHRCALRPHVAQKDGVSEATTNERSMRASRHRSRSSHARQCRCARL